MLYFLGDPHFGHRNIIKYCKRPFLKDPKLGFNNNSNLDVDLMDKTIVDNINNTVNKDDTLIFVGDVMLHRDKEIANRILSSINCENLHLVLGNHDRETKKYKKYFKTVVNDMYFKVNDKSVPGGLQPIHVYHYPLLSWRNRSEKKNRSGKVVLAAGWHIHGHTHGSMVNNEQWDWYYQGNVIDASVDAINFTPISYQQLKEKFNKDN